MARRMLVHIDKRNTTSEMSNNILVNQEGKSRITVKFE